MNLTRINIVLAVLLSIAVGLITSVDADRSVPNYEFLPQMKRSAASNAFSANSVFPDGRTLQAPVPGTIARGDLPLHYAATKEDAVRAGEELFNPFTVAGTAGASVDASIAPAGTDAADKLNAAVQFQASVQRGAEVYAVYCIVCHGASGAGDGSVAKRGFPPPPPLPTGKSVQMQDGQLFHILTWGQGSMSSMASQLSRDRRWDVINFVRSLQHDAAMPAQPVDTTVPGVPVVPENAPSEAQENRP